MADAPMKKPSAHEALSMLRQISPEHGDTLARHIYTDSMVPEMGNKFSYEDFLSRNKDKGFHVLTDLNDFKEINKLHGNPVGDQAIKRFGEVASKISRNLGLKAHRFGGDEFGFHAKSPEQATAFAHQLKRALEKEPKIGGTHNLAASIGIGAGKGQAEESLISAKKKLGEYNPETGTRKNFHTPGNSPSVVHSNVGAGIETPKVESEPQQFANPLSKSQMAIISEATPVYPANNDGSLKDILNNLEIPFVEIEEHFNDSRTALLVGPINEELAKTLAQDYGQESVLYINAPDDIRLIYVNGDNSNKFHKAEQINILERKPEDGYFFLPKENMFFNFWFNYKLE